MTVDTQTDVVGLPQGPHAGIVWCCCVIVTLGRPAQVGTMVVKVSLIALPPSSITVPKNARRDIFTGRGTPKGERMQIK